MIIDLSKLNEEKELELIYPPQWWIRSDEADPVMGLESPLVFSATLSPLGERFLLEGKIHGTLRLRCDRCLEEYQSEIKQDFFLVLTRKGGPMELDKELGPEDIWEELIQGDELDLDPIVKEQVYLFLPMKCLCHDGCLGICPNCGSNLNKEECSCKSTKGNPVFQKLAILLKGA